MSPADVLDRFGSPGDALADPCPVCGFTGAAMPTADVVTALATLPRRWQSILAAEDGDGALLADIDPPGPAGRSARAWALAAAQALGASGTDAEAITAAVGAVTHRLEQANGDASDEVWRRAVAAAHAGTHSLRPAQAAIDAVLDARR